MLDLFAGLGGWSAPFRASGWRVVTLDNDPRFGCDLTMDVRDFDAAAFVREHGRPTFVASSPPCETFSTLAFQRGHFRMTGRKPNATYAPATDAGRLALDLVVKSRAMLAILQPAFFVVENPRALLRQLYPANDERRTVWYCHLGHALAGRPVAKPTDLWGGFPPGLVLPDACHNQRDGHPLDCCCRDHVSAPRGSRTGTQGPESAAERAKVPFQLATRFLVAIERAL
jgi:hypothetical protein